MDNNEIQKIEQPNVQPPAVKQPVNGKGVGIASFVIGLVSITWPIGTFLLADAFAKVEVYSVSNFFLALCIFTCIANIILGTVGICLAAASKKQGFVSGLRTAGFALSLISLILGALTLLSCLACLACTGVAVKDLYSDTMQSVENMYSDTVDSTLDHVMG